MEAEFKETVWAMVDEVEDARRFHAFTVQETCDLLGITRQTYYNWRNRIWFPGWDNIDGIEEFLTRYGRKGG